MTHHPPLRIEAQEARGIQGVQGRSATTVIHRVLLREAGILYGTRRNNITVIRVLVGAIDTQGDRGRKDMIVSQVLLMPSGTQGDRWRNSAILIQAHIIPTGIQRDQAVSKTILETVITKPVGIQGDLGRNGTTLILVPQITRTLIGTINIGIIIGENELAGFRLSEVMQYMSGGSPWM